ncbi:TRAP transporter small permease [Octadecabacter sp. G9-8]|uniref:TRAP transporter small permease protein n=1 Tax=Octadecabacter dasysiphoniae TaxID=2909341 RepID=A0ABS9CX62_9RHOB|nr:TRAP transporter small permease subunit [Octadecabacter dasysiphoniae]MCF2871526.1 TRAP transporter small permease [Octadecabacter dasysiphoniae]
MFDRLDHFVHRSCIAIAVTGGVGLLVATVITCVSIILKLVRRGMENIDWTPDVLTWVRPILGEEELVQYGVALALFAALPYVMYAKGHITVDLFANAFGPRLNRVLDLISDAILATLAYLLFTRQWTLLFSSARGDDPLWFTALISGNWAEIADRLRDRQESQILGLKLWPTYLVAELLTALFLIVAVFCVMRSLRALAAPQ